MKRFRPGGWGWFGLVVYVVVADSFLISKRYATMSEVMGDALRNPIRRSCLAVLWAVLTLHLFAGVLPQWLRDRMRPVDPIGLLARGIETVL